jgi:hypothetical protein
MEDEKLTPSKPMGTMAQLETPKTAAGTSAKKEEAKSRHYKVSAELHNQVQNITFIENDMISPS